MGEPLSEIIVPDRASFKPSEVCELLKLQPYVLRSWENEFKDLGVAKTPGGPRTYRRIDVERALRIRHMVFAEGLTLAGVRRRFEQERPAEPEPEPDAGVASGLSDEARERIRVAREGLRGLLAMLGTHDAAVAAPSRPLSAGAAVVDVNPDAGLRPDAETTAHAPSWDEFQLEAPAPLPDGTAGAEEPAVAAARPLRRRATKPRAS